MYFSNLNEVYTDPVTGNCSYFGSDTTVANQTPIIVNPSIPDIYQDFSEQAKKSFEVSNDLFDKYHVDNLKLTNPVTSIVDTVKEAIQPVTKELFTMGGDQKSSENVYLFIIIMLLIYIFWLHRK